MVIQERSVSRNNVHWAKASTSPKLPFQQDMLTDVPLDLPSELSELKGPKTGAQTKGLKATKSADYSHLGPPCFSLAIAFCLDFKLHMWVPLGIFSSDAREEDYT